MDTTSLSSSMLTNDSMAGLLRFIDNIEKQSICSSKDFHVRHVLIPAAEASLRAYLHACASPGERLVLEDWGLCGPGDVYMCDDILNYTNTCKTNRDGCSGTYSNSTWPPSTQASTSAESLVRDPYVLLLLVGCGLLGFLLGLIATSVVCLVCPGIHSRLSSCLRCHKVTPPSRQTVHSALYAEVNDDQRDLQLSTFHNTRAAGTNNLAENGNIQRSTPTATDHSGRAGTGNNGQDNGFRSRNWSEGPNDAMHRYKPTNQSHNYETLAAVKTPPPTSTPSSDHDYFVLEGK